MSLSDEIKESVRTIQDFPKTGVLYRDITPFLLDGGKFRRSVGWFAALVPEKIDYVIAIESRGFIFGSALACHLGVGFVPIRKAGKLPHKTFQMAYELEYGNSVLEIHSDAMQKGKRAVIIDDVLATGGTIATAIRLVEKFGVKIEGVYFLIELSALKGREKMNGHPVHSLISY